MIFKKIIIFIADYWLYKIPFAIIFASLIFFGVKIFSVASSEEMLKDLYTIYISLLALTGAMSGIMFNYASVVEDSEKREEIKKIGEAFLYATINYIIVLLLTWVATNMKSSEYKIVTYFSQISFIFSYGYLVYAAISLYFGITRTFKLIEPTYYKTFD